MVTEDWTYERRMDGYSMNSPIIACWCQSVPSSPNKFILYQRSVFFSSSPFVFFFFFFLFFANYVLTKDK